MCTRIISLFLCISKPLDTLDKRYHLWYLLSMRWVVEYYEQADTTQPASISDLNQASDYWRDYQHTHKISPEVPEQEEQA